MRISTISKFCLVGMTAMSVFTGCSSDDNPTPGPKPGDVKKHFQIAFANGTGNPSGTLLQGVADLSTGTIRPIGHQMESSRTARIFTSSNDSIVWSLNYTVGTIEKLVYKGGDQYTQVGRIDASVPLGTKVVRFTRLNDKIGSVHYITAKASYTDPNTPTTYQGHTMTASIGMLNLETMEMMAGYQASIPVTISAELAKAGYYVSRIDCPVISGGKIYYGAALNKFDYTTGKQVTVDKTATLVLDYPALTNATLVMTDHVAGSTNGYRTPTQHINEQGEILQMVSGNDEVHIVKLVNGAYTNFDFNLSQKLNKKTNSNGFFYVGNGIAYIPYEDGSEPKVQIGVNPKGEPTYSSMWKVARMDLNKGTVVDLNVPKNLWLSQYQNSVVRDGKFYIALAPVGSEGNVYMFDINSESAEGTKGAVLQGTGAEQYYIGIY